jgi:Uma2 family endonuclease
MLDVALEVVEMQGTVRITGKIVARNMTYEEFLATDFKNPHVEWVNGVVIEMSPVGKQHNALTKFLIQLFEDFLMLTGLQGELFHDPMVMKLNPDLPGRAPDVQVVLQENLHLVKENEIAGAADLVVEVVSPGSQRQDRIEKYREYEKGGVKEYWILDPIRRETLFYQLNEQSVYDLVDTSETGIYESKVLNKLKFDVQLFWHEPLPRGPEITVLVKTMLEEGKWL